MAKSVLLSANKYFCLQGPFYLWVATLAAALYYGYGTLWYTVAFGVVALIKFVQAVRSEDRAPLLAVPAVVVSGRHTCSPQCLSASPLLIYMPNCAPDVPGGLHGRPQSQ